MVLFGSAFLDFSSLFSAEALSSFTSNKIFHDSVGVFFSLIRSTCSWLVKASIKSLTHCASLSSSRTATTCGYAIFSSNNFNRLKLYFSWEVLLKKLIAKSTSPSIAEKRENISISTNCRFFGFSTISNVVYKLPSGISLSFNQPIDSKSCRFTERFEASSATAIEAPSGTSSRVLYFLDAMQSMEDIIYGSHGCNFVPLDSLYANRYGRCWM